MTASKRSLLRAKQRQQWPKGGWRKRAQQITVAGATGIAREGQLLLAVPGMASRVVPVDCHYDKSQRDTDAGFGRRQRHPVASNPHTPEPEWLQSIACKHAVGRHWDAGATLDCAFGPPQQLERRRSVPLQSPDRAGLSLASPSKLEQDLPVSARLFPTPSSHHPAPPPNR